MSLELVNVSYIYDTGTPFERYALKDVSFSVPCGSFVGIVGNSGSGKTTLSKLMKGLLNPRTGQVLYDGIEVSSNAHKNGIGLVFQYPEIQLFENTVIKDVMFGPLNLGYEKKTAFEIAKEALLALEIDETFYNRDPFCLSGGEKRRVAISSILAMMPQTLILDEPTAGLDFATQKILFEVLKKLNKEGKTIILISHNMDDVANYCKEVIYMREGMVVAKGSTANVFEKISKFNENSNSEVFALPTMTSLAQKLRSNGISIPNGICTVDEMENALEKLVCNKSMQ